MRLFASKKKPYVPQRHHKECVRFNLSGSQWSMAVPPASSDVGNYTKSPKVNIYDPDIYADFSHLPKERLGLYPYYCFFSRSWGLFGRPWQLDELAYVTFKAMLYYTDDLPASMSCLVPAHFEEVLMRYLYFSEGPGLGWERKRIAPVNWQLLTLNGVNYSYCESHNDFSDRSAPPQAGEDTDISCNYFTPIDDQVFLKLVFIYHGYVPADLSLAAMHQLKEEIVSTAQLRLSDSHRKAQQKAIADNPTLKASETREPEKWVYPLFRFGDVGAGETFEVLVKKGSPPPPYRY